MGETTIIPANAKEIHSIEFLAGLDSQLIEGQDTLKERLQKIPGAWRDFRLAVTLVEKVLDKVYDTLPDKTLRHMQRLCQNGQIVIRPRPMVKMPDDVQIVGTEDLRMIINSVVGNECAICVKDHAGQKRCMLRRAMENIAPTQAVHLDGKCSYLDVVTGNELGKYI